ncbi:MAG: transposase, partial [Thermoflexibacter sp.]|nr:transposase [Thermoflexibacter sp.]
QNIHFFIRIRENTLINHKKGQTVKKLFTHLKVNQGFFYQDLRLICGVKVYVSAHRSSKAMMILIGSEFTCLAIHKYAKRWEIETMFKTFKTQGFQLESSHISDLERFKKLLALLAIAFYWAYLSGIVKDKEIQPIIVSKSTGRKEYYSGGVPLFVYGLDALREDTLMLIIK